MPDKPDKLFFEGTELVVVVQVQSLCFTAKKCRRNELRKSFCGQKGTHVNESKKQPQTTLFLAEVQ